MINTLISVNENDNEDVTNHTEEEDSDAKIIKTSISENYDNEDEYDAQIIKSENDNNNEDVTNHTEEEDASWENRNDTLPSPGFKASSSLVSLSLYWAKMGSK